MAMIMKTTRCVVLSPLQACAPDHCKMVPLTAFDRAPTDAYIPVVSAWKAPTPDNGTLIDGLLSTVARYPHLLGRMKADEHGRMCFHLNNAGMLIVEATADVDIADVLAHCTPTHVNELYPKANTEFPEDEPLFQVQLTRYKCGGLVIGTVSQHQVADGHSMSSFFTAWATAVRTGSSVLPTPFTDRTSTAVPRSPPSPSFNHRGIEFWAEKNDGSSTAQSHAIIPVERIRNFSVHFPGEFVAELKALAVTGSDGVQCSTFQCLLAHVWKKATTARGVPPGEATQVRVAVNCRSRASPPVGMDFFGNMVLWAFPRMLAGDLLSSSYAAVVGVIRDAVACIDTGYVQSFVDFVELADIGGEKLVSTAATVPGTAYCPDLEVDSWLGFRFSDLDFGYGPSCAFLQAETPVDGLMYFVRSSMGKDGVELFLALNDEHVDAFKEICYILDC